MKVLSTVLTSAFLLSGCSQISEHFYLKRNFNYGSLPGADAIFPRLLSLPLHPGLSDADIDQVCAALMVLARR